MQRRGISSSMKWEKFSEEFAEEPNYKALNCYDQLTFFSFKYILLLLLLLELLLKQC